MTPRQRPAAGRERSPARRVVSGLVDLVVAAGFVVLWLVVFTRGDLPWP